MRILTHTSSGDWGGVIGSCRTSPEEIDVSGSIPVMLLSIMRATSVTSVRLVMKVEGPRFWTAEDLVVDSAMELPYVEAGSVHLEKTESGKTTISKAP